MKSPSMAGKGPGARKGGGSQRRLRLHIKGSVMPRCRPRQQPRCREAFSNTCRLPEGRPGHTGEASLDQSGSPSSLSPTREKGPSPTCIPGSCLPRSGGRFCSSLALRDPSAGKGKKPHLPRNATPRATVRRDRVGVDTAHVQPPSPSHLRSQRRAFWSKTRRVIHARYPKGLTSPFPLGPEARHAFGGFFRT